MQLFFIPYLLIIVMCTVQIYLQGHRNWNGMGGEGLALELFFCREGGVRRCSSGYTFTFMLESYYNYK